MGLNETLDRLAAERRERERIAEEQYEKARSTVDATDRIREYAERIFFDRMLKDINHGMSAPKIEAMMDRSIMIAQMLHRKLGD